MAEINPNIFTQIDVTQSETAYTRPSVGTTFEAQALQMFSEMLDQQRRQTQLLEASAERMNIIIQQNNQLLAASQQANNQRAMELQKWQTDNPFLTDECREAMDSLKNIHLSFLQSLTSEIQDHHEQILENEYSFETFIDHYGPRLANLNTLMQALGFLGAQIKGTPANRGPNKG